MNPPLPARVTICLVLLLLGVSPAAAQHQALTGWFSLTVADYPPESGRAAETSYALTEDSGARHELLIDTALMQPLGGPVTLNRKRVTVVGEWEHDPLRFRARSIELAPLPSTASSGRTFAADLFPDEPTPPRSALPAAEADLHVRGSQAWVTILCRFGDARNITPHPVEHYERMMGAAHPGLEHYWREVSDENLPNLHGSVVVGWYDLPRPRAHYVSDTDGDGEEDADLERAARDCTARPMRTSFSRILSISTSPLTRTLMGVAPMAAPGGLQRIGGHASGGSPGCRKGHMKDRKSGHTRWAMP